MDVHRAGTARRWLARGLALAALWSIPAVIQAAALAAASSLKGDGSLSLGTAVLWRLPGWQVWALATPLIVWAGRRFPLGRAPWSAVPIHLALAGAIACGDVAAYFVAGQALDQEPFAGAALADWLPVLLLKSAFFELLTYAAVLIADVALAYQRRYREAALARSQLEARLVEAQLDALKQQLHPHFLFNTLNAITVLVRKADTAAALRMLTGLGDLLRRSLTSLRAAQVPLAEELDFVARYLDIETTRFPDRLRVAMDVEPAVRKAAVPSLLLQPIVENAIEHGIAPRIAGGTIVISARRDGARLRLEVRDDGVGLAAGAAPREGHGVGLSNVRKRLAQLYPTTSSFRLERADGGGTVAVIELPYAEIEPCAR